MSKHPMSWKFSYAVLVMAAALVLASCGGLNIGPPPAGQLYVLRPATTPPAEAPVAQWQLAVALPDAPDSLDTSRIALIRSQSVMDYYANSAWMDRTTLLVQSLLVEAFEKSGKINAVARETEGLRSDYILQTDIRDFEALYDVQDGIPRVIVRISARLVNIPQRNVISTITIDKEATAGANNVPAVVAAFNTATGAALNELVGWALRAPALPAANVDQIGADKPVQHRRRGHHRRH